MIHCPHRHPYGETYCAECHTEAARWSAQQDDKARVLAIINKHFDSAGTDALKAALAALRDDVRKM